ncbi:hypothetical protein SESBI_21369 [Sesbania bispinosa]|nr:hypothetical protein SESBI_21369 [Sesbania bispinosa]
MEEIKWRCMRSLLFRTENPVESSSICSEANHTLDDVVRTTYVDEIKFDSYDLANIMLLDGCFLLELLITNENSLDDKIKSRSLGSGAEVGKMEAILSDLKLLENQIPLFILPVLFKELFVEYPQNYESLTQEEKDKFEKESNEMVRKIANGLVLFLFSCSSESNPVESPNYGHLLELIHWFMTREDGDGINQRNNHHSITVERNFYSSTKPNLKLCAERLEAVGVKIKALDEDKLLITNEKSLDDKIKSRSLGPGAEVGKMEAILCSSESNPVESPNCGHLLELIHWFMTREDGDGINRRNNHHSITVERNFYSSTKPNLKLCAERLEVVGVKVKALDEDSIKKGSMLITIRLKDKKEVNKDVNVMFGCDKKYSPGQKLRIQPILRTTYVDEIKFDSYDLANIMLLDGCFLLELLITNEKSLDDKIKSRSLGPGAEVGKMEAILSDLKLLENQIPLFILPVLFKERFVEYPQNYESLTQEEKDKFEK